jgi:site-specific recombinase XerD
MDESLINDYVRFRQASGKSWIKHKRALNVFGEWLAAKDLSLSQLTPQHVNAYLCCRKSSGVPRSMVDEAYYTLRVFLRYALSKGLLTRNPAEDVSLSWLSIPGGFNAYQGGLRKILSLPKCMRKYRFPLFAPYWESYLGRVMEQGYSNRTISLILFHNLRFHRYVVCKKVRHLSQITPKLLTAFLRRRGAQFQEERGYPLKVKYLQNIQACVGGFLTYAFAQMNRPFYKPKSRPDSQVLPNKLLAGYLDFCGDHRGLSATTKTHYHATLLQLRSFLRRRGVHGIEGVTAADLDAFCFRGSKSMGASSLNALLCALRSFFRYLYLEGKTASNLAGKLMTTCRFRDALRPKYLPWNKVQQLLAGVDRNTSVGKRDYAILALLAHHGIRAGEAARLKLSDIDWEEPCMLLRERKNGSTIRLPLSEHAKKALQDYLSVRPNSRLEQIFLTEVAPLRPLGDSLRGVARTHLCRRFGRTIAHRGSHVLRHSFAKALLDRGGALHEIALLLGQESLSSALIYTRIATEDLREVSNNYADLLTGIIDNRLPQPEPCPAKLLGRAAVPIISQPRRYYKRHSSQLP